MPLYPLGKKHGGVGADFILHPLIHTIPPVTSAQNVGGGSQQVSDHKLKYDMFSQTRIAKCWAGASTLSVEILLEADYK